MTRGAEKRGGRSWRKLDGGVPRETGFDISVASEVMAILALTLAAGYA